MRKTSQLPSATPNIFVSNRQRTFKVSPKFLISVAEAILSRVGQKSGELSIVLLNDPAMRKLNSQYRGKDCSTDVLAFPQDLSLNVPEHLIGDVIISLQTAARQAKERKSVLRNELVRLLIHGILHLLGYDHEKSLQEATRMKNKERLIIKHLKINGITSTKN